MKCVSATQFDSWAISVTVAQAQRLHDHELIVPMTTINAAFFLIGMMDVQL